MQARKLRSCLVGASLVLGALAATANAATTDPAVVAGNPKCSDLDPSWVELKVEPPRGGTFTDGSLLFSVESYDPQAVTFDWSAEGAPVTAVIVKGGPNSNVYYYDPGASSDTSLTTVTNPRNGKPYGFSHISACYDAGDGDGGGGETPTFTAT